MPAEEFVAMVSDRKVLGDPTLMTQHFQGASKWEKVSDDEIIGYHQLRVLHQRYTDETRSAVALKGHAHSSNTRKLSSARPCRPRTINRLLIRSLDWYKKVDGEVRLHSPLILRGGLSLTMLCFSGSSLACVPISDGVSMTSTRSSRAEEKSLERKTK